MKRLAFVLTALALAFGCGDDEPVQQEGTFRSKPSRVVGAVTGRVLDPLDQPMAEATVRLALPGGERIARTDPLGFFRFRDVPVPASLLVRVEKADFTRAFAHVEIEAEAGDYPQGDEAHDVGDIVLFPLGDDIVIPVRTASQIDVKVVGAHCAYRPTFVVRHPEYDPSSPISLPAESAPGVLRCKGAPRLDMWSAFDGTVEILVPAQDLDGDGVLDHLGQARTLAARELYTAQIEPIVLEPRRTPGAPLNVVSANVSVVDHWEPVEPMHTLGAEEPAEVVFDLPAETHAIWVEEGGGIWWSRVEVEWEVEEKRLRFWKPGGWKRGLRYSAVIYLSPKGSHEVLWIESYFQVESSGEIEARAHFVDVGGTGTAPANQMIWLRFSEVVSSLGSGSISVQVDADLDGSGEIGDAPYERGSETSQSFLVFPFGTLETFFSFPVAIRAGSKFVFELQDTWLLNTSGEPFSLSPVTLEARE